MIYPIEALKNFSDFEYLSWVILFNICPTLTGDKPSTLINLSDKNKNILSIWEKHKDNVILPDNIEYFELKCSDSNKIILFFDRQELQKTLIDKRNVKFLSHFGYSGDMSVDDVLKRIRERYSHSCPHEIGIILGIPLKDVMGFLGMASLPCTHCGYWKVYGNPRISINLFDRYAKVKHAVLDLIKSGSRPHHILRYGLKVI